MAQKILITPSILSANLAKLQEEVDSIEPYADWIQVDVMDGHFVPNLTFGASVLKDLRTKLPLDFHLMVTNPAERIDELVKVKAHNITFHAEAVPDTEEQKALIKTIHGKGCTAGIAINPDTSLNTIRSLLSSESSASSRPDLILCMTVHPGFAGQEFHEEVLPKIEEVRRLAPDVMIQVDGGIDAETSRRCREAGATNVVSASYIFGAKDRKRAIELLRL